MPQAFRAYETWMSERVSGASLGLFRVLLGVFIAMDAWYFGWTSSTALAPVVVSLRYPGLGWWPQPGPFGNGAVCAALFLCGVATALGIGARVALAGASLCIAHVLAYDASYYLNHIALMLILTAVGAALPLDARFALRPMGAARRDPTVPRYALALVIGLFAVSYFFGGLNKLRVEWTSGALFYRNLIGAAPRSFVARWFLQAPLAAAGTWAGLGLDLLAPALLAWRRSRVPMAAALALFHLLNHLMFDIGLFSYLMVFAMVLYFDPAWPDRALARARAWLRRPDAAAPPGPPRLGRAAAAAGLAAVGAAALASLGTAPAGGGPSWERGLRPWGWQPARPPGVCAVGFRRTGTPEWTSLTPYLGKEREGYLVRSPGLARELARQMLCPDWKQVQMRFECYPRGDGPPRAMASPERDVCGAEPAGEAP